MISWWHISFWESWVWRDEHLKRRQQRKLLAKQARQSTPLVHAVPKKGYATSQDDALPEVVG